MFSFITHVRNQPQAVAAQQALWHAQPTPPVELILIDDCSSRELAPRPCPPWRLARSIDPLVWNYGVKNLGAQLATRPWMLFTNVDHLLTPQVAWQINALLRTDPPSRRYFRLWRKSNVPGAIARFSDRPHIGTILIHRDAFEAIGGYDEDFCGAYGHDDTFMQWCLQQQGFHENVRREIVMENISDSLSIPDADFRLRAEWPRDLKRNNALLAKKQRGAAKAAQPRVRFDWHLVEATP